MTPTTNASPTRDIWRRRILVLLILAAAVHVTITIRETRRTAGWKQARFSAIRWPDEQNAYVLIADGVAERGAEFLKDEKVLRSPPMPWVWLLLWQRNIALTRFVNIALVLLGSYLVARVARSHWGDRLGLLAFALCAMGYQVVLYTGTVLTEPLALFFCCLILWMMDRLAATRQMRYAIAAGIACGLGALSRTSLQLLPFAIIGLSLAAWLLKKWSRQVLPGYSAAQLSLLLACHFAVIAPVMWWNYRTFGVARIANGLGAVLYLGSDLRTDGDEPPFYGMQYQTGQITQQYDHLQTRGDELLTKAAKENIRRHPIEWLALCMPKIGRILVGNSGYQFQPGDCYRAKARLTGSAETAIVFGWWTLAGTAVALFGVAGLFMRWREQPVVLVALAMTAYLVALHAVTFSLPRFGLPFYPALVLGVCGYLAVRPTRWAHLFIGLVLAITCGHLALYHQYFPRCVVSNRKLDYFTRDYSWDAGMRNEVFTIETGGIEAAFNACVFVRATATRQSGASPVDLKISARMDDAREFDPSCAIFVPLVTDGREHLYQMCVEMVHGWRGHKVQSLRLVPPSRLKVDLTVHEVVIGH